MRKRYGSAENKPNDDDDGNLHTHINRNSIHSVPFYAGIAVLISLGLLYGLVDIIDNILPTPLTISDEKDYPDSFIAERAINDLDELTKIGPRITGGYENEFIAVNFLERRIYNIIQHAHPNQKIELDLQLVSGAYNLDLLLVDQINVYANVQNVVVKLHGKNDSTNSVLINSHFDSVPTSPGGSDDGINVAAMLEILRKMSKSPLRPTHNVIFLFNGAEETPLQAAHGFITQHKWANGTKVVVNLEACGAGGKIILFQSGPDTPWIMKYYSRVPHPYGQAAGEEIFQTGWIPSDTDFRIFRDYGGLVGVDMAFYKNGYRYHTKYDDFEHIPHGSYQHVGDNTLSLIKDLADAPEVENPVPTPGKMVYFDVLGWFMVSYTTTTAVILNLVTVFVSVSTFVYSAADFKLKCTKSTFKYLGVTLAGILGSWLTAGFTVCAIAYFLDLTSCTMSWYANPWMIFGLYMLPTVALSGCFLFLINHDKISSNIKCHVQAHVVRLIWTVILLVGTILKIRTMYALLVPVLFHSLAFIVIHGLRWQHTVRKWQVALITLIRDAKYFFASLAVIFVVFLVVALTPLGFPYRGNPDSPAPQRQWLLHTKRLFHNEEGVVEKTDAGIFFLNLDRNSPRILKNYIKDLNKAKPLEEDCKNYLLCGLPLSHAKMVQVMHLSTWIPANQPILPEQMSFTYNSKEQINSTTIRYNVTLSGSDRLAIYLVPKKDMKLVRISLIESLVQSNFWYNDRQLYFILFTYGRDPADLSFTFDVEVPEGYNGTTVDVAATAKYVHDKKFVKTPYYLSLIRQFPDWADVTPWLGVYSSYVL
ncbi:hypothetical protein NQ318_018833 [Aromia moschata]|uniref:FXNA-like protease n=1 Tax=Aromia moschata TaxID=1265417 RepID=A0AAV8ZG16_9CUCU|nr:hypothetical protein NQ318_018833 [Aromia moschata]